MGQHRQHAVSAQALETLLSDLSQATAVGELHWESKHGFIHTGQIQVQTLVQGCELGRLQLVVNDLAASEPRCQYLVNDAPIRRLDVNDVHRPWPRCTHKHRYVPETGKDDAYKPDDIPEVPFGPTVAPGTYRRVFEAFAAECSVALPEGYWTGWKGVVP
ncbi:hypothetical protein [Amycolatopsis sp. MEPSY49]|uniref:hypothetical protein n=1 Tax=Amycolatopsis sp. MEPSY49 TaxID=3151600 RepID=UPI003EF0C6CC